MPRTSARALGGFSLWGRLTYWRVVRPEWLYQSPDDGLETLFLNLTKLKRNGKVVWAHFVQANKLLYSPGDVDCLAEVVYSLGDADSIQPEELGEIAGSLAALKHTKPDDPELASIADYLTSEWMRVYGRTVPGSISPRHSCKMSTIYVVRKHLPKPKPKQWLCAPLIPLIVSPTAPHVAIPLPSRYWPKSLVEWWTSSQWSCRSSAAPAVAADGAGITTSHGIRFCRRPRC